MKKRSTTKLVIRIADGRKRNGKPHIVDAYVFGAFAAHQAVNSIGWNITHVPSGRAVGVGKSEFGAWIAARELSLDFDDGSIENIIENAAHVKAIIAAVR